MRHLIVPALIAAVSFIAVPLSDPVFGQERVPPVSAQKGGRPTAPATSPAGSTASPASDAGGQPVAHAADSQRMFGLNSGSVLSLLPADSVTDKTLRTSGGKEIAYTATAGTLNLFAQNGERSAAIFYTAYVAKNAQPGRPVTFAFNGGPGAASAFLNLGVVGPKVLGFGPNANDGAAAQLRDNPDSWLDFTDLVLIDPVGAGWSRTAKAEDAKNFYGVRADADTMAKVIALYVARNSRGTSPKYLLGESYGGFRAAKVASRLMSDQGIAVTGIVMLSPLIDGAMTFGSRLALGAALQLPPLIAAELERRGAFSADAIKAGEQFAMTDYLTMLAGPYPTGKDAEAFYTRVAELSGVSLDTIRKTRGFIGDAYIKHLRESDSAIVSRYDAALAAPDPNPETENSRPDDPVLDGFVRSYGGAFASYAREELGFKTDMTYTLLSNDAGGQWDWGRGSRYRASAEEDIRQQLALTPSFRLMVAHGYSDVITPYTVSKYIVDHLPPELTQGRVSLKTYRGGHMFYTRPASRSSFTADAKAFYAGPAPKD